ncbi:MAG: hypothetical protein WA439_01800, partial [Pseudolabrys sp.]
CKSIIDARVKPAHDVGEYFDNKSFRDGAAGPPAASFAIAVNTAGQQTATAKRGRRCKEDARDGAMRRPRSREGARHKTNNGCAT